MSQPPDPAVLRRARRKGHAPRAGLATAAAAMFAMLIGILFVGPRLANEYLAAAVGLWRAAPEDRISPDSMEPLLGPALALLVPLLIGAWALALTVGWSRNRFGLKSEWGLQPPWSAQRVAGAWTLARRCVAVALGALIALAALTALVLCRPAVAPVPTAAALEPVRWYDLAARTVGVALAVTVVLAVAEAMFSKWAFRRQMTPTQAEARRLRRGDQAPPEARSAQRARAREHAKRRSISPSDHVLVVVDPMQRVAVTLAFRPPELAVPHVAELAIGARVPLLLEQNELRQIPVVEDPPTARQLHRVNVGRPIPAHLHEAVAELMAQHPSQLDSLV